MLTNEFLKNAECLEEVHDYLNFIPKCDLSSITDDQIEEMNLTPIAKANVKRLVTEHRLRKVLANDGRYLEEVHDYLDFTSECDLSSITDDQIEEMNLTPIAKANVKRLVMEHRLRKSNNKE